MTECQEIAEVLRPKWDEYNREYFNKRASITACRWWVSSMMRDESQQVIDNVAEALYNGSAK